MLDIVVTVTIATLTGVGVMSGKMWSRLHELDKRVDQVELRVAEQYVSKKDLEGMLDRVETHLIRLENKLDKLTFR